MEETLSSQARRIALAALEGETRYDGSPFITHADGVASIVTGEIGLRPRDGADASHSAGHGNSSRRPR